jgi:hypothetical protein
MLSFYYSSLSCSSWCDVSPDAGGLELAFEALNQPTLERLLRQGRWRTFDPTTCLTRRHAHPDLR